MGNSRIAPLEPPYTPEIAAQLQKWMPPSVAVEPLALFRMLVRHRALSDGMRSLGSVLLSRGSIRPREREIVILRTCARCRAEYEWGVHATGFGKIVGLSAAEIAATQGDGAAATFSERERLLIRLVDELHESASLSDALWSALAVFSDEERLELLVLAGFYHLISFVTNGARVELEPWAARFAGEIGKDLT
jgi:alkylhydroperoxidase family enzyme